MGALKQIWGRLGDFVTGHRVIEVPEDEFDGTGLKAVPTAAVFNEASDITEATFPIPETAPVVATGAAITVGRPLRLTGARTKIYLT